MFPITKGESLFWKTTESPLVTMVSVVFLFSFFPLLLAIYKKIKKPILIH
ncbi:hypothetical protein KP78_30800 [Jeotgalibacillus soli]|uniref:Uncharacterized protein n=1 Tax=Jeotgalibacillus soli TaxID=889306 RepID=A0A0C2VHY8_9BACL|nr:hypothetical protein KP78_30800 [Jeotgalibacillus soli]